MTTWNDEGLDRIVGIVLRSGVMLSASVVLIGGMLWLSSHAPLPDHRKFAGAPDQFRHLSGIAHGVLTLDPLSIIQMGLILLIATPIVRVIACLAGFAAERDWTYAIISAVVLGFLALSNVW